MGTLLFTRGLQQTVCFTNYIDDTIVNFWSCVFVLSKVVELGEYRGFVSDAQWLAFHLRASPSPSRGEFLLPHPENTPRAPEQWVVPGLGGMQAVIPHLSGDTAFIILRKRPLIFIHWYHHSTVLLFTSFGFKNKVPSGGWFMTMNFGVHSIMYTYYTLRAAKVKHPSMLPMAITSLQILQMVMGTIVGLLNYIWRQEKGCYTTTEHLFWSFMLYGTYFLLFAHFFHQAYLRPKSKAKSKSQ